MTSLTTRTLGEVRDRLASPACRVVGWGTGSVYDYFQRHHPARLDYVIDNDRSRWGRRVHGVEVVSPDRLRTEDPGRTLVVIYSAFWPAIQEQLATIGPFLSAAATLVFAGDTERERLARFESLTTVRRQRQPSPANTIVVQGQVVPDVTAKILCAMTALHPHDLVLLSTWDDTELALLAETSAVADDVVLSERPAIAGVQNRNYQIVSSLAGIERGIAHGARRILKTRTDMALLAAAIFERGDALIGADAVLDVRPGAPRGRLVVPSNFTRKYLLYHPSDLVMLGDAADMRQYWSAPLDRRSGATLDRHLLEQPLATLYASGHPAESYLGTAFCRSIGRPVAGTLADSWAFYRDYFAVVENDWFEMLWMKNLMMVDEAAMAGVRTLVSHEFWLRLRSGDPSIGSELAMVDPDTMTFATLEGAPLG